MAILNTITSTSTGYGGSMKFKSAKEMDEHFQKNPNHSVNSTAEHPDGSIEVAYSILDHMINFLEKEEMEKWLEENEGKYNILQITEPPAIDNTPQPTETYNMEPFNGYYSRRATGQTPKKRTSKRGLFVVRLGNGGRPIN
ncbi:hypothetical protein [Terribacillus saccharophilus]|uniref:hypothetical protein n=1 Tax=Terribacillus saccharophilus TaxID=361277 RepID=UPI003982B0C9